MKVLIVRVGAMGDVLHALPAVAALRSAQPSWQIDWVVDPRWCALLTDATGAGPVVNRVHLADTRLWLRSPLSLSTVKSINALRKSLRAERYEIAVDMQGTLRSAVIARLSGASVRAGYTDPRERQAAWFYTRRLSRAGTHVVQQGAALLDKLFASTPEPAKVQLPFEPAAEAWAQSVSSAVPLCLLAPGAGWPAKQWPTEKFAALARALRAQGFDVAVTAAQTSDVTGTRVVQQSGGTARLLAGDVASLIAITRRAALVIGGDTGPVHLAASLGRPLVALFGPTDPARNGPWGFGRMRVLRDGKAATSYKHSKQEDASLARLDVDQVLAACLNVAAVPR